MIRKNNRKLAVATVIVLLTIVTITTIAITVYKFASPSNIAAHATQQNNMTTPSSSSRTFYLFNTNHDGVNQTKLGFAPDAYSETLTVNTGDTVIIHFYNVDTTDRHSFTLGGPYNVDIDLAPGQHSVMAFKASHQGIFGFFCKYHPTMTGQLVVL